MDNMDDPPINVLCPQHVDIDQQQSLNNSRIIEHISAEMKLNPASSRNHLPKLELETKAVGESSFDFRFPQINQVTPHANTSQV